MHDRRCPALIYCRCQPESDVPMTDLLRFDAAKFDRERMPSLTNLGVNPRSKFTCACMVEKLRVATQDEARINVKLMASPMEEALKPGTSLTRGNDHLQMRTSPWQKPKSACSPRIHRHSRRCDSLSVAEVASGILGWEGGCGRCRVCAHADVSPTTQGLGLTRPRTFSILPLRFRHQHLQYARKSCSDKAPWFRAFPAAAWIRISAMSFLGLQHHRRHPPAREATPCACLRDRSGAFFAGHLV